MGGKRICSITLSFRLIQTIPKEPTVDATVQTLIAGVEATYGPLFSAQVGVVTDYFEETVHDLTSLGPKDTPIGDLTADTWREALQSDIGVQASGSTAHPFYPGPITGADVFRVCGYGYNTDNGLGFHLATFRISGMALMTGLEFGVADLASTDDFLLQISGMAYKYDPTAPAYARVHGVTVNGEPLDPLKMYSVGANEFTALILQTLGLPFEDLHVFSGDTTEFQVLLSAVTAVPVLTPNTDGRVVAELGPDAVVEATAPSTFGLAQNYPNPFNPTTTIEYALPVRGHVILSIFNALGQQLAMLVQEEQDAGYHETVFDASHLASGVYLYRLQSGDFVQTRKLLYLK